VFVPLHDRNPLKSIPFQYVTVTLIAINVFVFVVFQTHLIFARDDLAEAFAVIPVELFSRGILVSDHVLVPEGAVPVPERLTLVTYMFLHGGWLHLIGNMAFLWVFGDNVEDAMGHLRFIMFYVMCGVAAALAHAWAQPQSDVPLIGASGGVAGIIAAYLMLHPKVKIWVLALWRFPIRITAFYALGFWVALQIFSALTSTEENVAWWAHIGGLAAGALLILFMRRPGVPLFDRTAGGA
jgi:membrane associated rhomboid family serine protease